MYSEEAPVKRQRGRPPKLKKSSEPDIRATEQQSTQTPSPQDATAHGEELSDSSQAKKPSVFATVLQQILKGDREGLARLTRKLEVTEQTIYRWMKGASDPRPQHLQPLLATFPEHHHVLLSAIQQTFPDAFHVPELSIRGVQKDIYRRVLELVTSIVEDDVRSWHIIQTIFDYALFQLDVEQQGLVLTFAQLMPERTDGVHSLHEVMHYGSTPWSSLPEPHVYLGSTTLAGLAALYERVQTWNDLSPEAHVLIDVDAYERSACAHPVMHAGQLAGVLVVSSTQPDFFTNPIACESVVEYAQLLGLAFRDEEFKPFSALSLRPMPALAWQRAEVGSQYLPRVMERVRQQALPLRQAEMTVLAEMEWEFEALTRVHGKWPSR